MPTKDAAVRSPIRTEVFGHVPAGQIDGATLERALAEHDAAIVQPHAVGVGGRTQFTRGGDTVPTPTHRQVTRATGGPLGTAQRAVASVDRGGIHRARENRPVSSYATADFTATDRQTIRQMLDHYRVVVDPEKD